jgi:hypothetical protein
MDNSCASPIVMNLILVIAHFVVTALLKEVRSVMVIIWEERTVYHRVLMREYSPV